MSDDLDEPDWRKKKRLRITGAGGGKRVAALRPKLRNHRLRRLTGLQNTVPSTQITWTLRQGPRAEHSEVHAERRDNIQEHSFWQVPRVTEPGLASALSLRVWLGERRGRHRPGLLLGLRQPHWAEGAGSDGIAGLFFAWACFQCRFELAQPAVHMVLQMP